MLDFHGINCVKIDSPAIALYFRNQIVSSVLEKEFKADPPDAEGIEGEKDGV